MLHYSPGRSQISGSASPLPGPQPAVGTVPACAFSHLGCLLSPSQGCCSASLHRAQDQSEFHFQVCDYISSQKHWRRPAGNRGCHPGHLHTLSSLPLVAPPAFPKVPTSPSSHAQLFGADVPGCSCSAGSSAPDGCAGSCKKTSQHGRRAVREMAAQYKGEGRVRRKKKPALRSVHLKPGSTQVLGCHGHFPHGSGEQIVVTLPEPRRAGFVAPQSSSAMSRCC